jgi:hypothetical protein
MNKVDIDELAKYLRSRFEKYTYNEVYSILDVISEFLQEEKE